MEASSGGFTRDELDRFELRVLELLCEQGKYHSSVALSCDLYGTTEDVQEERVLEWNLVELLLADLNEQGLVTYRLGEFDIFVHLRPTRQGYERLGQHYPDWIRVANFSRHHGVHEQPLQPGDRTDFRTHAEQAEGVGPVIHEDFIEHCDQCDHLAKHVAQLKELFGTDKL